MTDPLVYIDLETQSLVDLRLVGGRQYARHPSTKLLCLVAWIDGVYHLWTPSPCGLVVWPKGFQEETMQHHIGIVPDELIVAARTKTFVAHNADGFDRFVWEAQRPERPPWIDTMPLARQSGYPGSLDKLSEKFLGVGKDKRAVKVLHRVCKQQSVAPGELATIATYNIADVVALREIYKRVSKVPAQPCYPVHCKINERGVLFDSDLARQITDVAQENVARAAAEIGRLTDGEIGENDLRRRDFILRWVQKQGVRLDKLTRDAVQLFLDDPDSFLDEMDDGDEEDTGSDDDAAAFLAAIIADPDADLPRLVYADWLDERGEHERAEFIRVQVELARLSKLGASGSMSEETDRKIELCHRERELLGQIIGGSDMHRNEPPMLGLDSPLMLGREVGGGGWMRAFTAVWRRGFVEEITCSWADWLRNADAIRAATPLRVVRLTRASSMQAEWAAVQYPGITFELPPHG